MLNIFLCIISGFITRWTFPPYNFYYLAWISLIPFFYVLIKEKSYKKLTAYALLFGIMHYGLLFSSLKVFYAFAPKYLIDLAIFLYVLSQAVFVVLTVLLFKIIQRNLVLKNRFANALNLMFVLSFSWCLVDWFRSLGIFGNTLGGLAYGQYLCLPVLQLAKIAGPYGITFLIVFINVFAAYLIYDLSKKYDLKALLVWLGALIVLAVLCFSGIRLAQLMIYTPDAPYREAAIFQPAIPQDVKLDRESFENLKKMYLENIRASSQLKNPDLMILPETILPAFLLHDKTFLFNLRDAIDTTIVFGVPRYRDRSINDEFCNSVVLMNKYGDITPLHDKKYLVPFGEYIPFRKYLYWLFRSTGYFDSEYSAGLENDPVAGYGAAVCFESTFPYQLREQTKKGARLLLVLTNDAWFRKTPILEIHLAYAVFRAVENNRYLIQAANTGISAVIDNNGRIIVQSQIDEKCWVEGKIQTISKKTPYTAFGEILIYISLIYFLGLIYIILMNLPKKLIAQSGRK